MPDGGRCAPGAGRARAPAAPRKKRARTDCSRPAGPPPRRRIRNQLPRDDPAGAAKLESGAKAESSPGRGPAGMLVHLARAVRAGSWRHPLRRWAGMNHTSLGPRVAPRPPAGRGSTGIQRSVRAASDRRAAWQTENAGPGPGHAPPAVARGARDAHAAAMRSARGGRRGWTARLGSPTQRLGGNARPVDAGGARARVCAAGPSASHSAPGSFSVPTLGP